MVSAIKKFAGCAPVFPSLVPAIKKIYSGGNQCGKCVRAAREVMEDELISCRSLRSPHKRSVFFDLLVTVLRFKEWKRRSQKMKGDTKL